MAEQADKCDEAAREIIARLYELAHDGEPVMHADPEVCGEWLRSLTAAIIREVVAEPLQERAADHLKSLRVAADKATLLADWLRDWAE